MTTIDQIEKAVQGLSEPELAQFRAWFEVFDQSHHGDVLDRRVKQVQASIAQYDRGESRDGIEAIEELKQTLREQSGA